MLRKCKVEGLSLYTKIGSLIVLTASTQHHINRRGVYETNYFVAVRYMCLGRFAKIIDETIFEQGGGSGNTIIRF